MDNMPNKNPYIQEVLGASGPKAVMRGSRVTVRAIVEYNRQGYSPERIVREILPDLSVEQVNAALDYYNSNRAVIDKDIVENTEDSVTELLRG
jgi:uncharacterized protein (DUF433 family)